MQQKFGYKSSMSIPKLVKINLSAGIGRVSEEKERLQQAIDDFTAITGQKPVVTKAKKSVANFKIREGMNVGVAVTLRGTMMYEFLERLINIAIPRIRDFRGLPKKGFDGRGNYTFGLSEQAVFPEIDPDKIKVIQGMHITIVTTAETDEEGRELIRLFGIPFSEES